MTAKLQTEIYLLVHIYLTSRETEEDILNHADKLSELPLTTLKLHQLQIIKGTAMAKEFRLLPESFYLFELDEYIDLCVNFAERLNPDIYIERFTSQSPSKLLIAPEWGLKNYVVREKIIKDSGKRYWQGNYPNKVSVL